MPRNNNDENLPAPLPQSLDDFMRATYHPEIAEALQQMPPTPVTVTADTPPEDELRANAELINAGGLQLYEQLRRPHNDVDSVYKLLNATRTFLATRRKFLNMEKQDDLSGSVPVKPKVISLG